MNVWVQQTPDQRVYFGVGMLLPDDRAILLTVCLHGYYKLKVVLRVGGQSACLIKLILNNWAQLVFSMHWSGNCMDE